MKTSVLKKLAKIIVERIPEEEIRDELIQCLEEYVGYLLADEIEQLIGPESKAN
jgi:hypothetical protein